LCFPLSDLGSFLKDGDTTKQPGFFKPHLPSPFFTNPNAEKARNSVISTINPNKLSKVVKSVIPPSGISPYCIRKDYGKVKLPVDFPRLVDPLQFKPHTPVKAKPAFPFKAVPYNPKNVPVKGSTPK